MNCLEVQDKIIDLLLGEIDPEDEVLIQGHLNDCPLCYEDFKFLQQCLNLCGQPARPEFHKTKTYWDEFVISIHEKIVHESIEKKFPFRVVIPIAASALVAIGIGYYFFSRPAPQKTVQETPPNYHYDLHEEVYELSPEETEEFIRLINQRYGE